MRIRSVKPAFWTSEDIAKLSEAHALHFIGLWNYAQDNGVGRDDARLIRAALYPLREGVDAAEVEGRQAALHAAGLILRYRGPDGVALFYIPTWAAHHRTNNPSRCPYDRPTAQQIEEGSRATVALPEPSGSPTKIRGYGVGGGEGGVVLLGKGEKNGRSTAGAPPAPNNPVARLTEAWAVAFGPLPHGRIGRVLMPLLARYPEHWVVAAIAGYGRKAAEDDKPQYYTPEKFAAAAAQHVLPYGPARELTEDEARVMGAEIMALRAEAAQFGTLTARATGNSDGGAT